MYRLPAADERLGFGDVILAPWLFDLYLREDAGALVPQAIGGRTVLVKLPEPPEVDREGRKDGVLAASDYREFAFGHGNSRRAIILTDDCEMESLQGRGGRDARGRIVMAAIKDATDAEAASVPSLKYGQFGLPSYGDDFPAGIINLEAAFAVHITALVNEQDPPTHKRLISLDATGQRELAERWCAHATRHGPLVAKREAGKFANLLTANGDRDIADRLDDPADPLVPHLDHQAAARAIVAAAKAMWRLEGSVLDEIADAWAERQLPDAHTTKVIESLRTIRLAADRGLGSLGDPTWGPDPGADGGDEAAGAA